MIFPRAYGVCVCVCGVCVCLCGVRVVVCGVCHRSFWLSRRRPERLGEWITDLELIEEFPFQLCTDIL